MQDRVWFQNFERHCLSRQHACLGTNFNFHGNALQILKLQIRIENLYVLVYARTHIEICIENLAGIGR